MNEPWDAEMEALGEFIRRQRKLANLSLRQLAERARLSNPYLSQLERGLHQPSVRVIKRISEALNVSAETLLAHAGLLRHEDQGGRGSAPGADTTPGQGTARGPGTPPGQGAPPGAAPSVEEAIRADARLSDPQKAALIAVYASMLGAG